MTFQIVIGDTKEAATANHHWLNTWLIEISTYVLGVSEFSLRIWNVLAFIIALYAMFQLQKHFVNKMAALVLWLIFLNPFVLDFFSLARGYGLSIAFVLLSLNAALNLCLHDKEFSTKKLLGLYLYLNLALYANFTVLNFYLALSAIVLFHLLFHKKISILSKQFILFAALGLLPLIPVYFRLMFLQKNNELYYGTNNFTEMFDSLLRGTLYYHDYSKPIYTHALLGCSGFVLLLLVLLPLKFKATQGYFIAFSTFLFVSLALFIQHIWFDVKLPNGRTGLYLYAIFIVCVALLFDKLFTFSKTKTSFYGISILIVVLFSPFVWHFLKTLNTGYTFDWRFDACSKEVIARASTIKNSMLGTTWEYMPALKFYNRLKTNNMQIYGMDGAQRFEWTYQAKSTADTSIWKIELSCDCNDHALFKNKSLSSSLKHATIVFNKKTRLISGFSFALIIL